MKTIKNFLIVLLSATASLLLPGCFFNFDDNDFRGCLDGDGSIITEELSLSNFNGIELKIAADVFIRQGLEQEVLIEGQANLIDEIARDVRNGIWRIEADRCLDFDSDDLRIFITLPEVEVLRLFGSGDIVSENVLVTDDIELSINGSGDMDLALDADDINARISGSGELILEGQADVLNFAVSGSGDLRAFGLQTKIANISISGSGDAEVRVSDELEVRISGSGDVFYKGNPRVNSRVNGSGRVVNAN
jgi:hypothetical protein